MNGGCHKVIPSCYLRWLRSANGQVEYQEIRTACAGGTLHTQKVLVDEERLVALEHDTRSYIPNSGKLFSCDSEGYDTPKGARI